MLAGDTDDVETAGEMGDPGEPRAAVDERPPETGVFSRSPRDARDEDGADDHQLFAAESSSLAANPAGGEDTMCVAIFLEITQAVH